MTGFVLSFSQIDRDSIAAVGGKGANLGEMTGAGFPVPNGFCITTKGYHAFVVPFEAQIYERLEGLDPSDLDAVRTAGSWVRAAMAKHDLPENVTQAISDAWCSLPPDMAYAVRSSATAEDLPNASFAGQQDTYLNVVGLDALLEQSKQCFISLFTDRAILYRIQNGFPHEQVALSVVVQQMVLPQLSGIMFTADPISENRHIVSIDASFGLGEALVSGLVSADLYKFDKRDGAIGTREIATKKVAILPVEGGGTRTVDLEPDQQTKPALSDAQIVELARLGQRIEAHYGQPQDIEWAIADGSVFITQSRPITSLYPQPHIMDPDNALHIYLSLSHLQVMTDAMPPLAISIWKYFPPIGLDDAGEFKHLHDIGGRLFGDISPMLRHPIGRKMLTTFMGVADQLSQAAIVELVKRPEFLARGSRFNPLRVLFKVRRYSRRVPGLLLFRKTNGAAAEAGRAMSAYLAKIRTDLHHAQMDDAQRLEAALMALRGMLPVAGEWVPKMVAGMLSQRLLHRLSGPQNADLMTDIERGIVGNVVTDMNLAIGDMADLARGSGAVLRHLSRDDLAVADRLDGLSALPGGPEFTAAWAAFLAEYGARGPSEIDISRARWRENPSSLMQMVLGMTQHEMPGTHRVHYDALTAAADVAAKALPARVSWLKRRLVRRLVRVSRDFMPLREHHKFLMIQVLFEVKTLLTELAQRLVDAGDLETVDDVWFLQVADLRAKLQGKDVDLRTMVARRRSEFAIHARKAPPRVLTSDGEIPRPGLSVEGAPEGALIGSPVSAGVYEGVARVVRDPGVETLSPGEILVAPFTDPGWTPLFVNAGALVTEVGGLMTHGSVVAREYGIPAVVGVQDATSLIKTGDLIRINGDLGVVEIIEEGTT